MATVIRTARNRRDTPGTEQAEPLWPSILQARQLIDKHGGQLHEPCYEYIYWPN